MMGGGPTDPNQSLLSGGEQVPIHGVQGGGEPSGNQGSLNGGTENYSNNGSSTISVNTFTREAQEALNEVEEEEQAAEAAAFDQQDVPVGAPATARKTGARSPTKPPIDIDTLSLLPVGNDINIEIDTPELDAYIQKRKALWWRRSNLKVGGLMEDALHFSLKHCTKNSEVEKAPIDRSITSKDRLVVCLPQSTKQITVFPPVRGQIMTYKSCIKELNKGVKDGHVYLFSSPMYGDTDADNLIIHKHFVNMIAKSERSTQIFVVQDWSMKSEAIGCNDLTAVGSTELVPMFLEPTYVVYPYARNVAGSMKSGILFTAAVQPIEVVIPQTSQPSRLASLSTHLQFKKQQVELTLAFPPAVTRPDAPLEFIYKLHVENCYRPEAAEAEAPKFYTLYTLVKTVEGVTDTEKRAYKRDENEPFKSYDAEDLITYGVASVSIELGTKVYSFRDATADVRMDWRLLRFTDDEAAFLNDLNLRPWILDEVYAGREKLVGLERVNMSDWRNDLTDFLVAIVKSECFKDTRFISHSKCQFARDFLNNVFLYFLSNDERISGFEEEEQKKFKEGLKLRADTSDYRARQTEQTAKDMLEQARTVVNSLKKEMEAAKKLAGVAPGTPVADAAAARRSDPLIDGVAQAVSTEPLGTGGLADMGAAIRAAAGSSSAGRHRATTAGGGMPSYMGTRPLIRDVFKDATYSRQLLQVDKASGEYRYIQVDVNASSDAEAEPLLDLRVQRLREDYPHLLFLE